MEAVPDVPPRARPRSFAISLRLFHVPVAVVGAVRTWPKPISHELPFNPVGDVLAVAYVDGRVALRRASDGTWLHERKPAAEEIDKVDWSPDGAMLATAGLHAKITIWDARDLAILREMLAPEWVIGVKFSPDGMNLSWAGGAQNANAKRELQVWGIEGALFSLLNRPTH